MGSWRWLTLGFAVVVGLPFTFAAADDLPAEARELIAARDAEVAAIREQAKTAEEASRAKCLKELLALQEKYTKEAKLDEAVAIRTQVRQLQSGDLAVRLDPGTLEGFRGRDGESFVFEVVGSTDKIIHGDGIYSDDSNLASAAVHAGILKYAQRGQVKVTILPGMSAYLAANRNEVTSTSRNSHPGSYKVEAVVANEAAFKPTAQPAATAASPSSKPANPLDSAAQSLFDAAQKKLQDPAVQDALRKQLNDASKDPLDKLRKAFDVPKNLP